MDHAVGEAGEMTWTADHSVRFAIQLQSACQACEEAGLTYPMTAMLVSCASAVVVLRYSERGGDPVTLLERDPDQEWALPAFAAIIDGDGKRGFFTFETTDGVLEGIRN